MTLADLRDGDSVFIDANIFIYHFGGHSVGPVNPWLPPQQGEGN